MPLLTHFFPPKPNSPRDGAIGQRKRVRASGPSDGARNNGGQCQERPSKVGADRPNLKAVSQSMSVKSSTIKQSTHSTSSTDNNQTPPTDNKQTPPTDSKQTPLNDNKQTPPPDNKQTPPPDYKQTPPPDYKQTPPTDNKQTPSTDTNPTPPTHTNAIHQLPLDPPRKTPSYEQQRLDNIRKNLSFLDSLGLGSDAANGQRRPPARRKPKRKKPPSIPRLGTRRSLRTRGIMADSDPSQASPEEDDKGEEDPVSFVDSSVAQYMVFGGSAVSMGVEPAEASKSMDVPVISPCTARQKLGGDRLKKIYSMHFHDNHSLLAVGGHQGFVGVHGLRTCTYGADTPADGDDEEDVVHPALLEFKASKGWVSCVRFFGSGEVAGSCNVRLLTSSNDGSVSLWDVTQCTDDRRNPMPKQLERSTSIHTSGIFAMDVAVDGRILTGSKDATVAISRLGEAGALQVHRRYEDDFHEGVVKSVAWSRRNEFLFASTGNDCTVRVQDSRDNSTAGSCKVEGVHGLALNSVTWHPSKDHVFMASGFGPSIDLFDMRKPSDVVVRLEGHLRPGQSRFKGIYHPLFIGDGNYVMTTAEGTSNVVMFDAVSGEMKSNGCVQFDASCLAQASTGELALAHGREVDLFEVKV